MSAAAQSASSSAGGPAAASSARGFDVAPPVPAAPAPTAPAGSRKFQYSAEAAFTGSVRSTGQGQVQSRASSDGSLSGSASGSNLAASGFAEIRREEAEGADEAPRRTSGTWMRWSNAKDKVE
jgi:hypothetical protein